MLLINITPLLMLVKRENVKMSEKYPFLLFLFSILLNIEITYGYNLYFFDLKTLFQIALSVLINTLQFGIVWLVCRNDRDDTVVTISTASRK